MSEGENGTAVEEKDTAAEEKDTEAELRTILAKFDSTYTAELSAKMQRLDGIIGKNHWLSVGNYKEAILAEHLSNKLPKSLEVSTGFVMAVDQGSGARKLSNQIDILVWDAASHSPIFRDGRFVVVPPEACQAAIEVKSTLSYGSLSEGLANLDSLSQFLEFSRPQTYLHQALFAYNLHEELKFPGAVLRGIERYYAQNNDRMSLDARLDWSERHAERWHVPWVDTVAVLQNGAVSLNHWAIDGQGRPVYFSVPTTAATLDDTYGYLERTLLTDILTKKKSLVLRLEHPGMYSVLLQKAVVLGQIDAFMTMRRDRGLKSQTFGVGTNSELQELLKRELVANV